MSDPPGSLATMKLFTRYRILNATRAMVAEVGVERVTMRGIAAMANITAPAIYKHFRNKRALLDEVIAHGFSELDQRMLRGLRTPTPQRGLRIMIDQTVAFSLRYPRLFEMMMAPRTRDHAVVQRLERQMEGCMRAGVADASPPADVTRTLWAEMRGLLSLRNEGGEEKLRALYDDSMERVLRKLAA
jgi:AcrR family transcriptional regulator